MQTPTVGRKVWYWNNTLGWYSSQQPFDATVIYVWNPTLVNLQVTDHTGKTFTMTSVPLTDPTEGDSHDNSHGTATWMPYQKQQYESQSAARASGQSAGNLGL